MLQSQSQRLMPNFYRVHNSLLKLGADTAAIYERAGISRLDISRDQVGLIRYLNALQVAAELYQRPFLGLEIAQMRVTADLGLYGYMISNAADYRSLVTLGNEYMEVITPGAVGTLHETGSHALWTYEFPGLDAELCRQEVELTLMEFIWITRKALGLHEWQPMEVFFQHNAPENPTPLHQAMTSDVTFNHWFNGVVFPRHLLSQCVNDADPQLLSLLQGEVKKLGDKLKANQDLLTKVSLMIASGIGRGDISSERLAQGLYMSRRSLHRRLAEAGTTVQAIRDAVVTRLAKEMLSTTQADIAQIASALGFSESSAFVRSFKRLSGETPNGYRKRHGPAGD